MLPPAGEPPAGQEARRCDSAEAPLVDFEVNPHCCTGRMGLAYKSQEGYARPMRRFGASVAQLHGLELLLHLRGHCLVTHRFVESSGAVVESEDAESNSVGAVGTRVVLC